MTTIPAVLIEAILPTEYDESYVYLSVSQMFLLTEENGLNVFASKCCPLKA